MLAEHGAFLERAFSVLNDIYFGGRLPGTVITIQSAKKCYGYITVRKVWKGDGGCYREINITAEYLDRPVENVICTLLHEMCHLYAMEEGIKDTSNNGRYHNKEFKKIAEGRDLSIGYEKYIGWSVTSPTQGLLETLRRHGLDSPIGYVRTGGMAVGGGGGGEDPGGEAPRKKGSTRKYQCPGCGNSVRATKDVNIMCMDCMVRMEKQG